MIPAPVVVVRNSSIATENNGVMSWLVLIHPLYVNRGIKLERCCILQYGVGLIPQFCSFTSVFLLYPGLLFRLLDKSPDYDLHILPFFRNTAGC